MTHDDGTPPDAPRRDPLPLRGGTALVRTRRPGPADHLARHRRSRPDHR
ncbi:hypothetical protein ACH4Q6_15865 [Streptomyces lydicus]